MRGRAEGWKRAGSTEVRRLRVGSADGRRPRQRALRGRGLRVGSAEGRRTVVRER